MSILAQVMACCLTAPSHYLDQWWFEIFCIHPSAILQKTCKLCWQKLSFISTFWRSSMHLPGYNWLNTLSLVYTSVADSRPARRQTPTVARVFILQLATVASASGRLLSAVADCNFQSSTMLNFQCSRQQSLALSIQSAGHNSIYKVTAMQTWRTQVVIKHLKLQLCVCHHRPDCKGHRK